MQNSAIHLAIFSRIPIERQNPIHFFFLIWANPKAPDLTTPKRIIIANKQYRPAERKTKLALSASKFLTRPTCIELGGQLSERLRKTRLSLTMRGASSTKPQCTAGETTASERVAFSRARKYERRRPAAFIVSCRREENCW